MSESIAAPCTSAAPIPRGERRRREIAEVAERVFFESGYADTTMQMIAVRAGASKETLYRHFGSKEGLFAEIVETRAKSFLDDLDENFERPDSVEGVLRNLGLRMLDTMVGDEGISLCRVVVAEASRNPELGEIFFARGPDRVRARLAEFLAAARARGELSCADPTLAARVFLGAIVTSYHLTRLVLQSPPVATREEVRAHVDEVVDMFLLKYAR
jgi:TetR/AcrR family transcriptional regulator, mexJK operon transcriptional repressor